MRRHKIVVHIIFLILSVINFALAAPLSVRGIAEDVTTMSRKRWNPSDEWWTNSADRTNTPPRLGSSDSDYRSEQELRPHDPRSPVDPNPSAPSQPQPSMGSADSDVGSNTTPQPSLGSIVTDSDNSHPLPARSPPPGHDNPSGIDLNLALGPGPTVDQPPPAPPSDPGPSKRPYSPSDPGPSTWGLGPSDPGSSTWTYPPPDPGPSPSRRPHSPSDSDPSSWAHDPGLPNPGPLQHEPEYIFSELFRGKFKRRISGSRSVNAAQRDFRGTLESR
jgi:hypothetical protein